MFSVVTPKYPVFKLPSVEMYFVSTELIRSCFNASSVLTYTLYSFMCALCMSRRACALVEDVLVGIMGHNPGFVGAVNELPVMAAYLVGVMVRARSPCVPSEVMIDMELSLCWRLMAVIDSNVGGVGRAFSFGCG